MKKILLSLCVTVLLTVCVQASLSKFIQGGWIFKIYTPNSKLNETKDITLHKGRAYISGTQRIFGFYEIIHANHADLFVLYYWNADHIFCANLNNQNVARRIVGFGKKIFFELRTNKAGEERLRRLDVPFLFKLTRKGK